MLENTVLVYVEHGYVHENEQEWELTLKSTSFSHRFLRTGQEDLYFFTMEMQTNC